MNLSEQLAYCTEHRGLLETIRSTADSLLTEDPTATVLTCTPGEEMQFVNGELNIANVQLMTEHAEGIDDPEELLQLTGELNELTIRDAASETRRTLDIITAVSAGVRQLRDEQPELDRYDFPKTYTYEHAVYRQTSADVPQSSALLDSTTFSGLEHEGEGSVWLIRTDGIDMDTFAGVELVFLQDRPIVARWEARAPQPVTLASRCAELGVYSAAEPLLMDGYRDEAMLDQTLQNVYFQGVGTPDEEKVTALLPRLRDYAVNRRSHTIVSLEDTHELSSGQLRKLAIRLRELKNT